MSDAACIVGPDAARLAPGDSAKYAELLCRPVREADPVWRHGPGEPIAVPRIILKQLRKAVEWAGIQLDEFDPSDMHAFRSTLQTELERDGVPERINDTIRWHRPEGRSVGQRGFSRLDMENALRNGIERPSVPSRALDALDLGAELGARACPRAAPNGSKLPRRSGS